MKKTIKMPRKLQKKLEEKSASDNKAYNQAIDLERNRFETMIDVELKKLEEQEEKAVGSKLTATLLGQVLLLKLKTKLILS